MPDRNLSRRQTFAIGAGAIAAAAAAGPAAANQPRMEAALEHLKKALHSLENAAHDKGGHRVKAIEHVEAAIRQTEKGIRAGAA